jgi:glyoxylase-like metal-dependent hydrolase (beta-lactamase superfamily II)
MEKSAIESLFPGVFLIAGEVRGRPIHFPLLVSPEGAMLIDSGTRKIAEASVLPALRDLCGGPERLRWVIVTHPDRDHQGGNAALKRAAPGALLACGTADRDQVEDPDRLLRERYDAWRADHGVGVTEERRTMIRESSGDPQPVDLTFSGGERIRLDDSGWEVEILHLPGHSRGHIAVLDHRHHALYGGDALHGSSYLGLDGAPCMPPTYLEVDRYLDSCRIVLALARGAVCSAYVGCHWPVKRGLEEISSFCEESRRFCLQAEQLILAEVRAGPAGLADLIARLGPRLGGWPRSEDVQLRFALAGHLDLLERRGLIHAERKDGLKVYRG